MSLLNPCCSSQYRSATSWVLPNCGVAIFLPFRSAADVIPGRTTSAAPPEAAPAITRTASPRDSA